MGKLRHAEYYERYCYYALPPFIGALLSILLLGEPVTMIFIIASILMAAGCWMFLVAGRAT